MAKPRWFWDVKAGKIVNRKCMMKEIREKRQTKRLRKREKRKENSSNQAKKKIENREMYMGRQSKNKVHKEWTQTHCLYCKKPKKRACGNDDRFCEECTSNPLIPKPKKCSCNMGTYLEEYFGYQWAKAGKTRCDYCDKRYERRQKNNPPGV